jgi:hypothetical protein
VRSVWNCVGAGGLRTFAVAIAIALGALSVNAAVALASPPDMPSGLQAIPGDGSVHVGFVVPNSDGGSTITGYTVTASPGGATASGPASPITVTGLSNGSAYTFTVAATNADGPGPASAPSASVMPLPVPAASVDPAITGTPQVGLVLQASSGTWSGSPDSFFYQWYDCDPSGSDCSEIDGANDSSYTVSPFDGGFELAVDVTAGNDDEEFGDDLSPGTAAVTAQPDAPVMQTPPAISGGSGGQAFTAAPGTWSPSASSFAYTWERCAPDLSSCNVVDHGFTHTATAADVGDVLAVEVVAHNGAGDSVAAFSDSAAEVPVGPPTIAIYTPAAGSDYPAGGVEAGLWSNYVCSAPSGLSVTSCTGTSPDATMLFPTYGPHAFTVTATDSDGQHSTKTISYDVGAPPTITVTSPVNGASYAQNTPLVASFTCQDQFVAICNATQTPVSCVFPNGDAAPTAFCDTGTSSAFPSGEALSTSFPGTHTVVVTAHDPSWPDVTATVTYNVIAQAPGATTPGLLVNALAQSSARWRDRGPVRRDNAPLGTTFSFTSDMPAQVTFRFSRTEAGRKLHANCVALTKHNAGNARCTREVSVASLSVAAAAGANHVSFRGALGARKLAPGRYLAVATASNAGLQVTVGTVKFTIVK